MTDDERKLLLFLAEAVIVLAQESGAVVAINRIATLVHRIRLADQTDRAQKRITVLDTGVGLMAVEHEETRG